MLQTEQLVIINNSLALTNYKREKASLRRIDFTGKALWFSSLFLSLALLTTQEKVMPVIAFTVATACIYRLNKLVNQKHDLSDDNLVTNVLENDRVNKLLNLKRLT